MLGSELYNLLIDADEDGSEAAVESTDVSVSRGGGRGRAQEHGRGHGQEQGQVQALEQGQVHSREKQSLSGPPLPLLPSMSGESDEGLFVRAIKAEFGDFGAVHPFPQWHAGINTEHPMLSRSQEKGASRLPGRKRRCSEQIAPARSWVAGDETDETDETASEEAWDPHALKKHRSESASQGLGASLTCAASMSLSTSAPALLYGPPSFPWSLPASLPASPPSSKPQSPGKPSGKPPSCPGSSSSSSSSLSSSLSSWTSSGSRSPSRSGAPAVRLAPWTAEEDDVLRRVVAQHGCKSWRAIAEEVEGRDHVQCLQRWQKVLRPGIVKGPWTAEEDAVLFDVVHTRGISNWSAAAGFLNGRRTAKQVRERWTLSLDPSIYRGPWTVTEDREIMRMHALVGNQWAKMRKALPNRTENQCKTRYVTLAKAFAKDATIVWTPQLEQQLADLAARFEGDILKVRKHLPRTLKRISPDALVQHCPAIRRPGDGRLSDCSATSPSEETKEETNEEAKGLRQYTSSSSFSFALSLPLF